MIAQLAEIFFNVITPVFALVLIGYLAGPRLGLQARTLSRYAYFILIPCFVFNVIATAEFDLGVAGRMVAFILLVELACAALGFAIAKLLRRTAEMTAAYVLIATFGNVGNFGLPLIEFRLGSEALLPATIYFLAIVVIAFVIGVGVANWTSGGSLAAITAVLKTPALIAIVPAALVNGLGLETPLLVSRTTGLLGAAMVPTMLVALGVQLAEVKQIRLSADVWISSAVRLLGGAALALLIVVPFGLTGVERGAGIFQAAMPTAVLASIIAMEYKLLPDFVTTVVLFSTVASVITLTLLLAFV
ncbi:MAG: AEC family transporter [Ardenticatenaceae bacterium]|nr:AEC family transporter [Anaerolineales bacterium]MCB8937623.1 AEC family transporter [Ardenticatenaceae bacterium]MCB8974192.1 AEC family transporter [Ardenticatenaceae bacterium]